MVRKTEALNGLIAVAARVQALCKRKEWRFAFIGGLAVQRWGEPRVTRDVDLTLLTGFGDERRFIDELLKNFSPRVAEAEAFALKNRVVLLTTTENVGVDVALAAFPYEEDLIRRASLHRYAPKVSLLTCSAEDLVILKAFANRPRDWLDIEGVVVRQAALDWELIEAQLGPLVELKEEPEIMSRLRKLRETPRKAR